MFFVFFRYTLRRVIRARRRLQDVLLIFGAVYRVRQRNPLQLLPMRLVQKLDLWAGHVTLGTCIYDHTS